MKNPTLKLIALMVIFTIAFVSCKKDDTVDVLGQIEYDGSQYDLSKGYLLSNGIQNINPASYHFRIMMLSSDVTFVPSMGLVNGTGNGIMIDAYSSSQSDLIAGTYNFGTTKNANTFDWGSVALDCDFSTLKKSSAELTITGGTITVEKSWSDYKFTIDCTLNNGKTFTAAYKGSLTLITVVK